MDMDELQQAWSQLEARLATQDARLADLQRERGMDRVRARLRWLTLGQLLQLGVGVAVVLWAGGYWFDHRAQAHLLVYGLALHAYGLALLCLAVTQLLWLAAIDYHAPVLVVQRKLLRLRQLRVFSGRILLWAGMVAWVPLVLVALAAIGLDLWRLHPGVVWANLAAGLAMAVGVEWIARRWPRACAREHAGRLLAKAEAELGELDRPETATRGV